ncbi:phosphodiester glycosidase family protein [Leifsonia sp. YIM 134122]|uniref:Phosphodiester glycosidase family protein n=2 Tax=Leifsonia stereocauli TaxID=3134136 RepID=A0ABU9W469_9MICO
MGGGSAWALDRFVIPHVAIANVSEYEAEQSAGTGTASEADATGATGVTGATDDDTTDASAVVTDTSLSSDSADISISTVTTGSGDATVTYYVADVSLTDATTLRSAFAQDSYGENITETTSDIAGDNAAIFAINGDYYGFRDTGIVIRNGVVYRDAGTREGLAFYRDGTVKVYDETATSADELVADGVWNTLSFGPAIVEGGETVAGIEDVEVDTNFGNHSIQGEQPRTAIGVIDENHLVFVVVDGRSPGYSAGVTMTGLAQIMEGLGATTAYNIDGGGSSTMYFDGQLVNDPLGTGEERGTSDILYIANPAA